MVIQNMGVPDPPELDASLASNNDLIANVDIDTNQEDFNNSYEGYEQLNGSDDFSANDSDTDSDEEMKVQQEAGDIPPIENAETVLLKEVWTNSQSKDIEMDSDKVEAVKGAMLNFSLPLNNIPDWARNIPEQEWKDHVLKKIQSSKDNNL